MRKYREAPSSGVIRHQGNGEKVRSRVKVGDFPFGNGKTGKTLRKREVGIWVEEKECRSEESNGRKELSLSRESNLEQ